MTRWKKICNPLRNWYIAFRSIKLIMTFLTGNTERRNINTSDSQELLGLYNRILNSREGVSLTIGRIKEDPLNPKAVTFDQLVRFMRSEGFIIPTDESESRFLRTDCKMPEAKSYRDLHCILSDQPSPSDRKKQSQRRRELAKVKRSIHRDH